MTEGEKANARHGPQRRVLSESDVSCRGLSILLHVASIAVIAFLIVQHGLPALGKETDWVIATLTLFYVVVSFGMLVAIRHQIGLSRQTAERQLRAYVGPSSIAIFAPDSMAVPMARVVIRNYGQTTARNVVHRTDFRVASIDNPDVKPVNQLPAGGSFVLFPTQAATRRIELTTEDGRRRQLTKSEEVAIGLTDQAAYFVYGIIEYDDVFSERRTTTYRVYYFGEPYGIHKILSFHVAGNDAD
jgi:hypothetical protein